MTNYDDYDTSLDDATKEDSIYWFCQDCHSTSIHISRVDDDCLQCVFCHAVFTWEEYHADRESFWPDIEHWSRWPPKRKSPIPAKRDGTAARRRYKMDDSNYTIREVLTMASESLELVMDKTAEQIFDELLGFCQIHGDHLGNPASMHPQARQAFTRHAYGMKGLAGIDPLEFVSDRDRATFLAERQRIEREIYELSQVAEQPKADPPAAE